MSTKIKFGVNQIKKNTPKKVTIVCDWAHACSVFAAGYSAFVENLWLIFGLMIFSLTLERLVKPLFGEESDFKESV